MLIEAGERGFARAAADAAALLTERGLGGNDPDLELRHRRWVNDRRPTGPGGEADWLSGGPSRGATTDRARMILRGAIALAFPDRLSRRRDASGEQWQSVGGRGFRLDPASPLARSEWLAVAEVAGAASGARILSAAAIEASEVEALFAEEIEAYTEVRFDPATAAISATKGRKLGAIRFRQHPIPGPTRRRSRPGCSTPSAATGSSHAAVERERDRASPARRLRRPA